VDRAKVAGAQAQAAGKKAATHVSRNKAAYFAGGLGAAGVAANRRCKLEKGGVRERLEKATFSATKNLALQKTLVFKCQKDYFVGRYVSRPSNVSRRWWKR